MPTAAAFSGRTREELNASFSAAVGELRERDDFADEFYERCTTRRQLPDRAHRDASERFSVVHGGALIANDAPSSR